MNKGLICFMFILGFTSQVQSQTTFGAHAGINFQNINGKDFTGDKLSNGLAVGFNVGFNAEIPLAPEFFFQPGLMYSVKGSNLDVNGFKEDVRLGYIELPLNLLYKPVLGNGHLLLGFGPYIAYGITAGKDNVEYKNSIGITDNPTVVYIKNFDAGGNLFFGYELANSLSFQLNTQLGLVNILPDYPIQDSDTNFKNTGFGLSVGYSF